MRMSRFLVPLIAAVGVLMLGQATHADLLMAVDKSSQRMIVTVNGEQGLRVGRIDGGSRI